MPEAMASLSPASLPISALYLAVFALFSVVLAIGVAATRGKSGVSIGDGGRPELVTATRRHGNFVEYVPLLLLMLAVLELNGASDGLLHGLGLSLLVARVLHAVGIHAEVERSVPRAIGAIGTWLVTLVAAGCLLQQFLTR